jgi:hypothetical protein
LAQALDQVKEFQTGRLALALTGPTLSGLMDSSCRASCRTGSLDTVLWPLFRVGPAQRPDWPIGLVSGYQARPARSLLCYAVKGRRLATRVPGGTTARVPGIAAAWREREGGRDLDGGAARRRLHCLRETGRGGGRSSTGSEGGRGRGRSTPSRGVPAPAA